MFVFGRGRDKEKQHCKNSKVKADKRKPTKARRTAELEISRMHA